MTGSAAFRGQPLLLFGGVLAGWIALRVALWEPPFGEVPAAVSPASPVVASSVAVTGEASRAARDTATRARPVRPSEPGAVDRVFGPQPAPAPSWEMPPASLPPLPEALPQAPPFDPPRVAIGHSMLLALGLSQMQLPDAFAAYLRGAEPASDLPAERSSVSRWSADGWLLLRRDGASAPILSDRPSYGRSQAGAVVRYSLAPASALLPQAYMRGAAALSGAREEEAAAGLSVRPLPGVPLRAAAEARASDNRAGTRIRPAVYAMTEFPPLDLPLGLRGEAYAQAGYVGGEFDTAFVDGQMRAERLLARVEETEVSAGAGAWGGAQKDSARLDIGPTAAVTFRLGEARGRLAADYRFRVAGDAEPASGPALTVSAGF